MTDKVFIDTTVKELKTMRKNFGKTYDNIKDNQVLLSMFPFLVLEIGHLVDMIDLYISQYEKLKKRR